MQQYLCKQGYRVNRKRVQRLMRLMGIAAIYPKPRLSRPGRGHKIYPYLLRDLVINQADQVWCSDITYVRLVKGFMYLVVIMHWYSRYVLTWQLSNRLEPDFCVEALERALSLSRPGIFNTDQGVQFTATTFTSVLQQHQVRISMGQNAGVFLLSSATVRLCLDAAHKVAHQSRPEAFWRRRRGCRDVEYSPCGL